MKNFKFPLNYSYVPAKNIDCDIISHVYYTLPKENELTTCKGLTEEFF